MTSNIAKELQAVPKEQFLTVQEVAALFRVSPRTVTRWDEAGVFHSVKIGRFKVIPRFEVLGLLNKGEKPHEFRFDEKGRLQAIDKQSGKRIRDF